MGSTKVPPSSVSVLWAQLKSPAIFCMCSMGPTKVPLSPGESLVRICLPWKLQRHFVAVFEDIIVCRYTWDWSHFLIHFHVDVQYDPTIISFFCWCMLLKRFWLVEADSKKFGEIKFFASIFLWFSFLKSMEVPEVLCTLTIKCLSTKLKWTEHHFWQMNCVIYQSFSSSVVRLSFDVYKITQRKCRLKYDQLSVSLFLCVSQIMLKWATEVWLYAVTLPPVRRASGLAASSTTFLSICRLLEHTPAEPPARPSIRREKKLLIIFLSVHFYLLFYYSTFLFFVIKFATLFIMSFCII